MMGARDATARGDTNVKHYSEGISGWTSHGGAVEAGFRFKRGQGTPAGQGAPSGQGAAPSQR